MSPWKIIGFTVYFHYVLHIFTYLYISLPFFPMKLPVSSIVIRPKPCFLSPGKPLLGAQGPPQGYPSSPLHGPPTPKPRSPRGCINLRGRFDDVLRWCFPWRILTVLLYIYMVWHGSHTYTPNVSIYTIHGSYGFDLFFPAESCLRFDDGYMGMDQYLLIPCLGGWTSIHLPAILMFTRGTRFWHTAMWMWGLSKVDSMIWGVFWCFLCEVNKMKTWWHGGIFSKPKSCLGN